MPNYRRSHLPGGTYFFTVNLADRRSSFLIDHFDALRLAVHRAKQRRPFSIKAWVVLPDHMHWLWQLPEGDSEYALRWRHIKGAFTRVLVRRGIIREERAEAPVWKRRFWEHTIRDQEDFRAHADYIHINPKKHGHVQRVMDWPCSSFHHFVSKGVYLPDWAGGCEDEVKAIPGE